VIKGWLDAASKTHEQVYDVAWSGERKPGKDGKLPDFDAKQRAFYYVRMIEVSTPRWTTYDAKFFGVPLPKDVPASIQNRAYTSPIWYNPA